MRWLSDAVVQHLRALPDPLDLSGTKYDLLDKIGQGGMASVYLVRDRDLDRPVALKVLDAGVVDPQPHARLAQEARILARLEHPGIVPVHDTGVLADGRIYYAMKYVRGQRLDEYAKNSPPLAEWLQVFEKICQAVAFAHAQGVIHRDLKPPNIMIGAFGEVLVMDWGVAKLCEHLRSTTHAPKANRSDSRPPASFAGTAHGTVLGTPGYMAPEQTWGSIEQIDERTDVYALGATLYFLLTGRPPSPLNNNPHEKSDPALLRPRQYNSSIPRPLEAICLKALAHESGHRYAGVAALATDIARFRAEDRVEAYPEGLFRASKRLIFKYRVALVLILVYLAMRILLLIWGGT